MKIVFLELLPENRVLSNFAVCPIHGSNIFKLPLQTALNLVSASCFPLSVCVRVQTHEQ